MTRRLRALIGKELRTLFQSPIAYVVLTAFLVLNGVYFFQNLIEYNRELFVYGVQRFGGSIETGTIPLSINVLEHVFLPMASDMSLILLALIPLLTMRVFAEERSQGTDELLLTNSIMQVVPVIRVEKHDIGNGRVGPIARKLLEGYRARVKKECAG